MPVPSATDTSAVLAAAAARRRRRRRRRRLVVVVVVVGAMADPSSDVGYALIGLGLCGLGGGYALLATGRPSIGKAAQQQAAPTEVALHLGASFASRIEL